jgi:multidrug efflux pump subunit AcrA (membrane-fusion protein)
VLGFAAVFWAASVAAHGRRLVLPARPAERAAGRLSGGQRRLPRLIPAACRSPPPIRSPSHRGGPGRAAVYTRGHANFERTSGPAHKAKRRIWIGAVVAIAIAAVAAAVLPKVLRGDKDKKEPVPLEFIAAEVARPVAARLPLTLEFSGPLVAPRTAVVRAKAAGTLLSLSVAEGSRVKAGQVIGVIDLAEMQSRAADRAALVESAQAALVEAERQNTANVGLAAQNFISPTALQTSQARLDAARAQLKSAQAQLASMRVGIRDATLSVPISGIVGKRHVVPARRSAPSSRSSPSSTSRRSSSPDRSARTRCRCSSRARSRRSASKGRAATSRAASTASRPRPKRERARSASSSRSRTRASASAPASTRRRASSSPTRPSG